MNPQRLAAAAALAALLAGAAALETAAWVAGAIRGGTLRPGRETRRMLTAPLLDASLRLKPASARERLFGAVPMLHPYLGFVNDPRAFHRINEFGFLGPSPILKRHPQRLNVLLTGGSVAVELYGDGSLLKSALSGLPEFRGKEIVIVPACLGGYKQPQQLLALAHFLALGAEYDLVINLDGFNEAVIPFAENVPRGVEPSFPRSWDLYARRGLRFDQQILMGRMSLLRERREGWRGAFAGTPLRYSMTALTLWRAKDRALGSRMRALQAALERSLQSGPEDTPQVRGAGFAGSGTDTLFPAAARHWMRASLQMRALCEAAGARYFHFLQPNHHLPGSKPLTRDEERLLASPDPWTAAAKEAVARAYPLFRAEGRRLREAGVRFVDLSGLFERETSTVFRDSCCHYNGKGYQLLGMALQDAVGKAPVGAKVRP